MARQKQAWKYWKLPEGTAGKLLLPLMLLQVRLLAMPVLHTIRAIFVTLYSSLGSTFQSYSVKDEQHRNCGTYSLMFPVWLHITALIQEQDSSFGDQQPWSQKYKIAQNPLIIINGRQQVDSRAEWEGEGNRNDSHNKAAPQLPCHCHHFRSAFM